MQEHLTCWVCGIAFSMPATYARRKKENGEAFHCPNGDRLAFGDSETDVLRRERDRLKQQLAQKDDEITWQRDQRKATERQVIAAKGQITKLKKRASAGTCPCCKRTFSNMARHMKTSHPEFDPNVIDLKVEKAKRA